MSYSIVLYGAGIDGKIVEYPLSNAFLTIEAAVAEAKRVGASGPTQIFPFGGKAATGFGIRDESNKNIVTSGVFQVGPSS
jgi:hypothetical protein